MIHSQRSTGLAAHAEKTPRVAGTLALTIFSCENYMGPVGLAEAAIDPKYFTILRNFYERKDYPNSLGPLAAIWDKTPIIEYLCPAFRDPAYFARSPYGTCLASNETYRQGFKTKLRMYYGNADEVIRTRVGRLAYEYQETLVDIPDTPSSKTITPSLVDGGDHHMAFIKGAAAAKAWLDTLP